MFATASRSHKSHGQRLTLPSRCLHSAGQQPLRLSPKNSTLGLETSASVRCPPANPGAPVTRIRMTEIVAKVGIGVKSEMGSRGQRTENRGKAQLLREWKINV